MDERGPVFLFEAKLDLAAVSWFPGYDSLVSPISRQVIEPAMSTTQEACTVEVKCIPETCVFNFDGDTIASKSDDDLRALSSGVAEKCRKEFSMCWPGNRPVRSDAFDAFSSLRKREYDAFTIYFGITIDDFDIQCAVRKEKLIVVGVKVVLCSATIQLVPLKAGKKLQEHEAQHASIYDRYCTHFAPWLKKRIESDICGKECSDRKKLDLELQNLFREVLKSYSSHMGSANSWGETYDKRTNYGTDGDQILKAGVILQEMFIKSKGE